ncbi:hypothetical protein EO98_18615 [Methanosarcina sp. 2.H.T.1A.6]|uniref:hypothetical protein n=1 Tax=unclassified Methanosarcina TaxID=2644672 RepID=UPI000622AF80|nr:MULTISPECIES: hypothetical protein [unclassified Methanosarcina]KKG17035.1 hypothetical protein EO94_18275 [Methanosarcina sp. 2.H.T.1A.3]KKG20341.1 hypothetical protein EO98_18615 [Methanosarcina sp. 2.H.T.1A.6]KKG23394.1 hypothetical protein EO96_17240 [Methanosarcina sp. 2.H.T.1A.8]KKG27686.1 hypothetical protein EO97_19955 [Methanosarcina sp. 2.H.T.1A.15]
MILAEILNQLKELEIKFKEISYPLEATFQPSFFFQILKAELESMVIRIIIFLIKETGLNRVKYKHG